MAALVAPGAPVSVLIEYGLAEKVVEQLLDSGVGTIEKLGNMTPEQLEEIQGIGPLMVEQIQDAVNAYYGQFEDSPTEGHEPTVEAAEAVANVEAPTEEDQGQEIVESLDAGAEPGWEPEDTGETGHPADPDSVADSAEEPVEAGSEHADDAETVEQFGTIEDAGSPTHNQSEGAGPKGSSSGAGSPNSGQ
jgi:N utilization substance protein A